MHNLLECSSNYSDTIGSLWFYSKNEATNFDNGIGNTCTFKSFKVKSYKVKLLENTAAQPASDQENGIVKKCNNCCAIKISK